MANQNALYIVVTRVDGPLYEGYGVSLYVPGSEGDMEILKDHSALISPLRKGEVVVTTLDGEKQVFAIESGTLEVSNNQATVLI